MRSATQRGRTQRKSVERDVREAITHDDTPPGIHNLEAMHTLALLFPLLGMTLPVGYSCAVYLDSNMTYLEEVSRNQRFHQFTPDVVFHEPFSAFANAAYFTAGMGLYLIPFLSGDFMPKETFAIALYLMLLGGASGTFHQDGSQTGTWRHHADRFGMYMPFAFLTVAVFNGLFHAVRGRPASPRSLCGFITGVSGLLFATICLVFQESIASLPFLITTGFIIFTANFITLAALHYHRQGKEEELVALHSGDRDAPRRPSWKKALHALLRALPTLFIRLLCLGLGFALRLAGNDAMRAALYSSNPLSILPENHTIAERVELRKMHDFLHGSWHFFTAVVIMGLGLTLVEGLSGELTPPKAYRRVPSADSKAGQGSKLAESSASSDESMLTEYGKFFQNEHPWELASLVATAAVALITISLHLAGASSTAWLVTWLMLTIILVPFELVALYKVVKTHSEKLGEIHQAEVRVHIEHEQHAQHHTTQELHVARAHSGTL